MSADVRLQKFLAGAGLASRRKAEALIQSGRVKVNNAVVTELGTKIDPERDLVTVDGRTVSAPEDRVYVLLYKPPGCITTASDPQGRPTALEYLRGLDRRVFPVGRLDFDAEGALLFTDDGELANRLAHPRYGHRRVYLVKVKGEPPEGSLERMVAGVRLEDGPAQALEAVVHEHADRNVWIRVAVGEGRFHLVKRLCESVGLQVQRLFRPEFGGISVEGLRPGAWRPLTSAEIRALKQTVGLVSGTPAPDPAPRPLPKAARRHGHGPPAPPPDPAAPPPPREERGDRGERGPRPDGRERAERDERPDRNARPERRERAGRDERPERRERAERAERPQRGARPEGREREGRNERPERGPRPERRERPERGERPERRERPERGSRPERRERPERAERPERVARPASTGGPSWPGAGRAPERSGKPAAKAGGPRGGKPPARRGKTR